MQRFTPSQRKSIEEAVDQLPKSTWKVIAESACATNPSLRELNQNVGAEELTRRVKTNPIVLCSAAGIMCVKRSASLGVCVCVCVCVWGGGKGNSKVLTCSQYYNIGVSGSLCMDTAKQRSQRRQRSCCIHVFFKRSCSSPCCIVVSHRFPY